MAEENILYEIKESIAEIKSTLKSNAENTDLKFQLQEEKIKVANNRISDLENSNTWLWRTIAGALISTVIAFLINFIEMSIIDLLKSEY